MELDTVAKLRRSFYRLVGSESGDQALLARGEDAGEVANIWLTSGARSAQRWMLRNGFQGWRKRSAALSFSGTDAADGGQYATLPSDFMQAYSTARPGRSALVSPDGTRWGHELRADEDHFKGNFYYFRGHELWLARGAQVPTTLYLDYHYLHPSFEGLADGDIDFPLEARRLIPTEAAEHAKEENWLPGGQDMELKIARATAMARAEARHVCRVSKTPRRLKAPFRVGNHY